MKLTDEEVTISLTSKQFRALFHQIKTDKENKVLNVQQPEKQLL